MEFNALSHKASRNYQLARKLHPVSMRTSTSGARFTALQGAHPDGSGGGGVLNKGPTPHPFHHIPFMTDSNPFRVPFVDKLYPFHVPV